MTIITNENQSVIFLWEYFKEQVKRPLLLLDYAISNVENWELAGFICVFAIGRMLKDYRPGAIQGLPDKRREMWVLTVSKEGKELCTLKRIIGEGKEMVLEEVKAGDDPFLADARPSPKTPMTRASRWVAGW